MRWSGLDSRCSDNAMRRWGQLVLLPWALWAHLALATVAQAAPLASVSEPSLARAYDQRWEATVRSCAASVARITERPVIYQVGFAGSVQHYTTNRQEHLMVTCLELKGML